MDQKMGRDELSVFDFGFFEWQLQNSWHPFWKVFTLFKSLYYSFDWVIRLWQMLNIFFYFIWLRKKENENEKDKDNKGKGIVLISRFCFSFVHLVLFFFLLMKNITPSIS